FRAGSSTGPSDRWLRWRLSASRPSTCSASETGTRWQSCAGGWTISVRSSIRFRRESRRCAARSLPGGRCTPRCGRRSVRRRGRIRGAPGAAVASVVEESAEGDFGKHVMLDHGNGVRSLYGHLKRHDVKVGQRVAKGQVIGLVGSTGRSTGPHLHYEVLMAGKPVDPSRFLW